jgi:hypothetical protein
MLSLYKEDFKLSLVLIKGIKEGNLNLLRLICHEVNSAFNNTIKNYSAYI